MRILKIALYTLYCLLLLAATLEAAGQYLHYSREGRLFSYRGASSVPVPAAYAPGTLPFVLHPYYGFVHRPGLPGGPPGFTGQNNRGFLSNDDYPLTIDSRDFVVGFFGGSVAVNAFTYEATHRFLQQRLEALPALQGRRIRLINLAKEAWKQPQHVVALLTYILQGQKFDAVIVIDGFNETSSGWNNDRRGIDLMMPNSDLMLALAALTGDTPSQARIDLLRAQLLRQETTACRLAVCWGGKTLISEYLRNRASSLPSTEPQRTPLYAIDRSRGSAADVADFVARLNDGWEKAALIGQAIAAQSGAAYLQILQPNQYYPTARSFSEAEQRIAFIDNHPYRAAIKPAYDDMRRRGNRLAAEGRLNFLDATTLFDDTAAPVYRDNCCHYNETGDQVFAEAIAEALIKVLQPR